MASSLKRLEDLEREAWTAQVVELHEYMLENFGEYPDGDSWFAHDRNWTIRFHDFVEKYGPFDALNEMSRRGYRQAHWRKFPIGGACYIGIELIERNEELRNYLEEFEMYWVWVDESGQALAMAMGGDWNWFIDSVKIYQREWDVVNTRKTSGWKAQQWANAVKIAGIAIAVVAAAGIIVVLSLFGVPIAPALPMIAQVVGTVGAVTGATQAAVLASTGGYTLAEIVDIAGSAVDLVADVKGGTVLSLSAGDAAKVEAEGLPEWVLIYDEAVALTSLSIFRGWLIEVAGVSYPDEDKLYREWAKYGDYDRAA